MTTDGTDRQGLRARKKLATRQALGRAAFQLAVERGPENVRVEDIAAAANVAPRTYNNYFSSVEEAICSLGVERAERVGRELRARPADEPLAEAITAAMVAAIGHYVGDAEPDKEMVRAIASARTLRGEFLNAIVSIERPLAQAIADRTGLDAELDLMPQVVAAATASAARTATMYWLSPGVTTPFTDVLRAALTLIGPVAVREPAC